MASSRWRFSVITVIAIALAGAWTRSAKAQDAKDSVAAQLFERLASASDSTQHYALRLPRGYRADHPRPILFILDARGRALLPLHRVEAAADRFGYIVVSSYNTASDGPPEPNYRAMTAMLTDVQRHLAIDGRRLYLMGFSGTARVTWDLARQLSDGAVAGIIGVGAGLPGPLPWLQARIVGNPFVFFGAVGNRDFNYDELRQLDAALAARRFTHRLATFDGPHEWPPAGLFTLAFEWLELQAMRRGLRPVDRGWVDSLAGARLAAARAADAAGTAFATWVGYREMSEDFDSLVDVGPARQRAAALANDAAVRRTLAQLDAVAAREREVGAAIGQLAESAAPGGSIPSVEQARARFKLPDLKRDAAGAADTLTRLAAARMLERLFVFASYYLPEQLMAAHRYTDAAAMLSIALDLRPSDGYACLRAAEAHAQRGKRDEALVNLSCAAADARVAVSAVEGNALLAPIAGNADFARVLTAMRERRPPPP